jgi:phosphoglycolate phosphatase
MRKDRKIFPFGAVLFDLDGTLIDSITDVANAVNRVLSDDGLSPIEGELRNSLLGEGARARILKAFSLRGKNLDDVELTKRTGDFMRYYSVNQVEHTKAFDGAALALEWLSQAGVKIAVCTNKDEIAARAILTKLQLMPWVADVAGADTFGVQKPHPDHVLKLLTRIGIDANDAFFVGDSVHDVQAAKNAGVTVAAVTWGYSLRPASELGADYVFEKFSDLMAVGMVGR